MVQAPKPSSTCLIPSMVASIASIIVQSDRVQNVKVDRLYTQEEVMAVRQKSRQLYSAYRPAGQ